MTATTPPADRIDPPYVAGERPMLDAWLDYHRATLLWKCEGLDDDQLKRASCPPSDLTLIGLVRHMAEVERGWFRWIVGGDKTPFYCTDDDPDADIEGVEAADPAEDLAVFRAEVDELRSLLSGHDLDESWVEDGRQVSLRWIFVHMLEEYARHNGHADLLRERIDGATGS